MQKQSFRHLSYPGIIADFFPSRSVGPSLFLELRRCRARTPVLDY